MNGVDLTFATVGALALLKRLGVGSRSVEATIFGAVRDEIEEANELLSMRTGELMPSPTSFLDSGSGALVFETSDPGVVVRIAPLSDEESVERQELLTDEDFLGGVVKVLATSYSGDSIVTWKERLDTNVEGFILRRHERDPKKADQILEILSRLYDSSYEDLYELQRHPETRGLANACLAGMPCGDLTLHHNLGVTSDGRVVAYDI